MAPSGGIHPHTQPLLLPVLQTLHDLQLGGADDEGSMEAALNTINAKDPAFTTNPSALSHAPSRVPSGHIRQVTLGPPHAAGQLFCTVHSHNHQLHMQQQQQAGRVRNPHLTCSMSCVPAAGALPGP